MIRRWLGSVAALVGVSLVLAGCAYELPDTDALEDTLETIESVDHVQAYVSGQVVVGLIVSIEDGPSVPNTAIDVADAFLDSDFGGYRLNLGIQTGRASFNWIGYDPYYAERYRDATALWQELVALPGVEESSSSGDAFVRGTEFGFRFSVADDTAADATLATVRDMIADAGFVVRATGVGLVD